MTFFLSSFEALVLDCQATLSSPETGHLLEIGWGRINMNVIDIFKALETLDNVHPVMPETDCEFYLVWLPEGVEISRRVSRMTGLKTEDQAVGLPPATIWKKLTRTARHIAAANGQKRCLMVIHYSHFELSYLQHLYHEFSA